MNFKPGDEVVFKHDDVPPLPARTYAFGMVADDDGVGALGVSYMDLEKGTPVLRYTKVVRAHVIPCPAEDIYSLT